MGAKKRRAYRRRLVGALRAALVEFGYPDLTEQSVIAALDAFFDGREPRNVIEMIIAGELRKAGAKPGDA